MAIIVQKFGGTSVGTGQRIRAVAEIIAATAVERSVIGVVSAISGTVKSEGTTSKILAAAQRAVRGEPFDKPLSAVNAVHRAAIKAAIMAPEIRAETQAAAEEELARLRSLLSAIQVIRELSPRSEDLLICAGERLSGRILSAALRDRGTKSVYVDLSDVVDEGEDTADTAFFARVQESIAARCVPGKEGVPIVTGFFGLVPGGLLQVVGRGYTDFTAALIAAGLGRRRVAEMQVWKEVDGIYTADPRKVAAAHVLPTISPMEAAELTYFGSEVLHPFTMERVVAAKIPIRIKNTFHPEGEGTVIVPRGGEITARATAVTAKRHVAIVTVSSNRMYNAYGFLSGVFKVLADHGIVVDLVSTSEVSISFTVEKPAKVKRCRKPLERFGHVAIEAERAILSMVGEGMKYAVGTSGLMFSALGEAGVNIEMISQGASEINISCVIREEDTEKALAAVHRTFLE